MIKYRVLITSVSGVFGPKNIDFMKESIKGDVWVLGVDKTHSYIAEKKADKFAIVPSGNSISYINKICELIELYNISLVLPCSDEEAINLSENRIRIECAGASLATADFSKVKIMSNKISTYELFSKSGIDVPEFKVIRNVLDMHKYALSFYEERGSFVVKDAVARGNRGTVLVDKNINGKIDYMGSRELHVGWKYFNEKIIDKSDGEFPKLITERLYKPAYDIDILAKNGKIIHAIPRERINPAGVPYQGNIIRNNVKLLNLAHKVAKVLNLSWLYDVDVMTRQDGTPVVLEVNPRPSGSSVASMECGAPLYRDLLQLFSASKFKRYDLPKDGTIISPSLICNIIQPKYKQK